MAHHTAHTTTGHTSTSRTTRRGTASRIARTAALALGGGALAAAAGIVAGGFTLYTVSLNTRSPLSTFAHKDDPRFAQYDDSWRHSDTEATSWFEGARHGLTARSMDGLTLHAWRFDPDTARPLPHCYAIVMHGYTGAPEETAPWAWHYARLGFTVLCPAERGHEESQGRIVTMGARERDDLLRWVNRVVAHDPQATILLHGNSLGAPTVCLACGDPRLAPNVTAAIVDSAYLSAAAQLAKSMAQVLRSPRSVARPMVCVADLVLRMRDGASLYAADALAAVRRARADGVRAGHGRRHRRPRLRGAPLPRVPRPGRRAAGGRGRRAHRRGRA
ncbi:MAG: alpha/beta hydrolase [Bifidobacterium sp.]|nr:alpha/beta hydrolase [Bifidobacterium sp.]